MGEKHGQEMRGLTRWDPFGELETFARWDPFGELETFARWDPLRVLVGRGRFSRLMEEMFGERSFARGELVPSLDSTRPIAST